MVAAYATVAPIDNRQSTIDNPGMRILIIDTYYPEFLSDLYRREPELAELAYDAQLGRIYETAFSVGDAYSAGLRALGWEAREIICNADVVQAKWAAENVRRLATIPATLPSPQPSPLKGEGAVSPRPSAMRAEGDKPSPLTPLPGGEGNIHEWRRRVVAAQIDDFRPDVLYVFEWSPLGDAFLAEMKSKVRLLVGQIASPLPANRTFRNYDLMISSFPPLVDHFRCEGLDAEPLKLAFDSRLIDRLPAEAPAFDVSFVGGFAPSHAHRIPWLEAILREIPVDIFGYGLERVPPGSAIHAHYRGPAWGLDMYRTLMGSRITMNLHARIDIRGHVDDRFANNMRLYEATGMGTCLLTDAKANLHELFEPDREVLAFSDEHDCVEKLRYYLEHPAKRDEIAAAGQRRTLREHTYSQRMTELHRIVSARL